MRAISRSAASLPRLDGVRVLVVEDEFLIALELAAVLADAGAEVVGPSQTLESALALAEDDRLSAAILDMRLGADTAAPVARRLAERGVPFFFYSGQTETEPMRAEWPDSWIVSKPALPQSLVANVAALISRTT